MRRQGISKVVAPASGNGSITSSPDSGRPVRSPRATGSVELQQTASDSESATRVRQLSADLSKVHVGMKVFMYAGNTAVVQAVVDDLAADQVSARVIQAAAPTVSLAQGTRT